MHDINHKYTVPGMEEVDVQSLKYTSVQSVCGGGWGRRELYIGVDCEGVFRYRQHTAECSRTGPVTRVLGPSLDPGGKARHHVHSKKQTPKT